MDGIKSLQLSPEALAQITSTMAPAPKPEKKKGAGILPYASLAAGTGLDIWGTHQALKAGGRELNPILPGGIKGIAGMKALMAIPPAYLIHEIGKRKPGLAKALGVGAGIFGAGLGMHNLGVAREMERRRAK